MGFASNTKLRPALIVVDRSGSMFGEIGAVETRTEKLLHRLATNGALSEILLLGVWQFDYEVDERVAFGRITGGYTQVQFETREGKTNFTSALHKCYSVLATDLPRLARYVYRPLIFFISDGGHNFGGDFEPVKRRLAELPAPPKIVVFEIRGSDHEPETLRALAGPDLYVSTDKSEAAIDEIMDRIFNSLGGFDIKDPLAKALWEDDLDSAGDPKVFNVQPETRG